MRNRALAVATAIVLLSVTALRADDPNDAYVNLYSVLKEADQLSTNGATQAALVRYQQAEVELRNLQKSHPEFNPQLIQYREAYVERRLEQLASSNTVAAVKAATPARPPKLPLAAPTQPTAQPKPAVNADQTANPSQPVVNPGPAANPVQPPGVSGQPPANAPKNEK